ncbi:MAG: hypothetical protein R3D84_07985 [Paracoccaceae bacterium]
MAIRRAVATHPILKKYFKVLTVADMVPEEYRRSGAESYYDPSRGWTDIWEVWAQNCSFWTPRGSRWRSVAPAGTATRSRPAS